MNGINKESNKINEYRESLLMITSEMTDQFEIINNRLIDKCTGEIVTNIKHILQYLELINK